MPLEVTALPAGPNDPPRLHCTSDQLFNPFVPVISANVPFNLGIFFQVCEEMVLHPERNSSSILRCDILQSEADQPHKPLIFNGFHLSKTIRRRILPRRPFDGTLDQTCHFYESVPPSSGLVVLVPELKERAESSIPFYHPKVAAIAFRFFAPTISSPLPNIQLDFLPLEACPSFSTPSHALPSSDYYPESSRTYRTALNLISTLVKHGKGLNPDQKYVKRVHHDTIVPKETFQDVYLQLKEKYTWILDEWKESTDPLKHVFEDVAIATFLICLWNILYPKAKGKPPGGFVDVGCGNGLLVFILHKEGYQGYGIDLRARKSWALWGSDTPLRTTTLSPAELCLSESPPFPVHSFLIGNHADELTPWLPLLASRTPDSAFLNIPCCFHTFTGRFTSNTYKFSSDLYDSSSRTGGIVKSDIVKFDSLASEKSGRYYSYLVYIAEQTARAGWRVERDALRIPSTKCWAFVGRNRLSDSISGLDSEDDQVKRSAEEEAVQQWIQGVAEESLVTWQPRKPEGKDH